MSSAQYLFVYGTLQSQFVKNRYARYLGQHAELAGEARMAGRLYAFKRYPALRAPQSEEDWVRGEVYRLRTPVTALDVLDVYESGEYRRVRRWANLADRGRVLCWVYVFRGVPARHRRVESGRWPESAICQTALDSQGITNDNETHANSQNTR